MPTMPLKIATKASQALIVPVLLVATYINQKKQGELITVVYDDVESVGGSGSTAATALNLSDDDEVHGDYDVIRKMVETFPDARGKQPQLVGDA